METLLVGPPISQEEQETLQKQRQHEERALEVVDIVLRLWFDAYSNGGITFETLCRNAAYALTLEHIPGYIRQKKMGAVVEEALRLTPSRNRSSPRSTPAVVQAIYFDMVEIAAHRGFPKDRIAEHSAFLEASNILNRRKIKTTESSVFNSWQKESRRRKKANHGSGLKKT